MWVFSEAEVVLSPLTGKYIGKYKCSVSLEGHKILTELVFHCCQTVYPVQSQPKQPKVTKPILVISPATVEINRAVQSLLKHCPAPPPPPTGRAVFWAQKTLKAPEPIRLYCINSAAWRRKQRGLWCPSDLLEAFSLFLRSPNPFL